MKLNTLEFALTDNRKLYRVYLAAGEIITGRVIEHTNEYLLMRYIMHPGLEDLRIVIDLDHIAAIEER